jgi:two-component system LytT family response regulator
MRILICDDEVKYVNELKVHVQEYMKNHFIQCSIEASSSPKEFLKKNRTYDLVFLDIQMPEINGLEIAHKLKERNSKVVIFFVTAYNKYQDDAMDLQIFRFFEKPFDVKRLYSSLDKAMEYIDGSYVDVFVQNNTEHIRILVDDIIYIKRDNRKNYLFTKDNTFVIRESIMEWNNRLPTTFFYLVHKSFLVNLHYVTKYNYTELFLNETIRVPIASRKQAEFHKFWFDYLIRR